MKIRELELITKENPELEEKFLIEKFRFASNIKRDWNIYKKSTIICVTLGVITIISLILMAPIIGRGEKEQYPILNIFTIIMVIVTVVSILFLPFYQKKQIEKIICNILKDKYKHVERLNKPSKKVVSGKEYVRDSIRNCYNFSYRILKFNCIFSNYNQEKYTFFIGKEQYNYYKFNNFMEYRYDLKKFGILNIDESILSRIDYVIEELKKIKFITVDIEENYLIIIKETVFNSYNTEDARRDVDDVEFFYNEIVKLIIDEVK